MILHTDTGATLHALRVYQSPCYDVEGMDWFLLRLDSDLALRLLDQVRLFQTVKAKDHSCRELVFADHVGCFIADADLYLDAVRAPEPALLVVTEGEVFWKACEDDDVELSTESISIQNLRDVAGRAPLRIR